jgi:hypothetical protein
MRKGLLLALALGCGVACSYKHLYGETMRGVELRSKHRIHVLQHAQDKRNIDDMIADRLRRAGFEATSGPEGSPLPEGVAAVVTYEDHWMWDMSNYLIVLRIDFRDPDTNELLASGQSYRTSLDRKPPEYMVDEVLAKLLQGPAA